MGGVTVTDWEWRIAGSASKMARIAERMGFRIVDFGVRNCWRG